MSTWMLKLVAGFVIGGGFVWVLFILIHNSAARFLPPSLVAAPGLLVRWLRPGITRPRLLAGGGFFVERFPPFSHKSQKFFACALCLLVTSPRELAVSHLPRHQILAYGP